MQRRATVALDGFGAEQGFDVLAAGRPPRGGRRDRGPGLRPRGPSGPRVCRRRRGRSTPRSAIGNEEDPVGAVRSPPRRVGGPGGCRGRRGQGRRAGQPRLDRRGDGRRDLRAEADAGRSAPGAGGPAAGPRRRPSCSSTSARTPRCAPSTWSSSPTSGSAFSRAVLGVEEPRVGLLSVGEEAGKGTPVVAEANERLRDAAGIRFIGNVEGRDLPGGAADVVVTDGFTGNVVAEDDGGDRQGGDGRDPRRGAGRTRSRRPAGCCCARRSAACAASWTPTRRRGDPARAAPDRGGRPRQRRAEGIANAVRLAARCVEERAVERTERAAARVGRHPLGPRRLRARGRRVIQAARNGARRGDEAGAGAPVHRARGGPARIEAGTRFREDLDADSLDLYELVMELEDRYGIRSARRRRPQIKTVGDAVDFVCARAPA